MHSNSFFCPHIISDDCKKIGLFQSFKLVSLVCKEINADFVNTVNLKYNDYCCQVIIKQNMALRQKLKQMSRKLQFIWYMFLFFSGVNFIFTLLYYHIF